MHPQNIQTLFHKFNREVVILYRKLTEEGHTKLELLSPRSYGLTFVGGSSCQVFYFPLFLAAFVSVSWEKRVNAKGAQYKCS
jgi:hypothetical protein